MVETALYEKRYGAVRMMAETGIDICNYVTDLNTQLTVSLIHGNDLYSNDRLVRVSDLCLPLEVEYIICILLDAGAVVYRSAGPFARSFGWASKFCLGKLLEAGGKAALQQNRALLMRALSQSCVRRDESEQVCRMLLDAVAKEDVQSVFQSALETGNEAVARMLVKLYPAVPSLDQMREFDLYPSHGFTSGHAAPMESGDTSGKVFDYRVPQAAMIEKLVQRDKRKHRPA